MKLLPPSVARSCPGRSEHPRLGGHGQHNEVRLVLLPQTNSRIPVLSPTKSGVPMNPGTSTNRVVNPPSRRCATKGFRPQTPLESHACSSLCAWSPAFPATRLGYKKSTAGLADICPKPVAPSAVGQAAELWLVPKLARPSHNLLVRNVHPHRRHALHLHDVGEDLRKHALVTLSELLKALCPCVLHRHATVPEVALESGQSPVPRERATFKRPLSLAAKAPPPSSQPR